MSSTVAEAGKLSKNETLKAESNFLRGTLLEGLSDYSSGALSEDNQQLLKFHGSYQQDDRDTRNERRKQKLDKAYIFMVRVGLPGGVCSPSQWLTIDRLADEVGNGTMKLTTRQAFQLHGIIKFNLKQTIKEVNQALMTSLSACGDVNRNVMCTPNPFQSEVHAAVQADTEAVSAHLKPRSRAYHEIWLDEEKVAGTPAEEEPIYGKTYLPRKFKTVFVVPPLNDVDVFAHDLGFIAIVEQGKLVGYNLTVGGGLGMTHNNHATYPRLADVLGYFPRQHLLAVAEAVVTTQRDFGDRADRKHARLKYTIEDMGVDGFRAEVEKRAGVALAPARPYEFTQRGDRYGWVEALDGTSHLTLFIEHGRVADFAGYRLKSALRAVAQIHQGDFRLTANQNLIIGGVTPAARPALETILREHGVLERLHTSGLRLQSMACVALPTCGLALAESERYLPSLVTKLEDVLGECGLRDEEIVIRMTGCPNGCARPFVAEIGLVGRSPGKYNLYLGGDFVGQRLNKLYRDSVTEAEILEALRPILQRYAQERLAGERFGDFCVRAGYVQPVQVAKTDFWASN